MQFLFIKISLYRVVHSAKSVFQCSSVEHESMHTYAKLMQIYMVNIMVNIRSPFYYEKCQVDNWTYHGLAIFF